MLPIGVNAVSALALGALGARLDPYAGSNFLVEIEGVLCGGFREVKGLESSVDVKEYVEGGQNEFVHRLAGPVKHVNLTLSRGLIDLDTLWAWYDDVTKGVIVRRNMTIMLLDASWLPVVWWEIRAALPVKWVGPSLNAEGDTLATETLEFVHNGLLKPTASRALTQVRAVAALAK